VPRKPYTLKDVLSAKRAVAQSRERYAQAQEDYIETLRLAIRDGVSQSEIARELGVSRQRVAQLLDR